MNGSKTLAPIFIIGYLHSGTTMLRKILDNIPTIYTNQGETRFFNYLPQIKRRFASLDDPVIRRGYLAFLIRIIVFNYGSTGFGGKRIVSLEECGVGDAELERLLQLTSKCRTHAEFYPITFDYFTDLNGKERWLEKTPTHLFHVNEISTLIPNAQFIELVRDPRAILASKKSRLWHESSTVDSNVSRTVNMHGGYDPLWDSLAWKSAVRASTTAHAEHPAQILQVRYEDLVENPNEMVQQICEFLNVPFKKEYLNVGWVNTRDEGAKSKTGIQSSSVAKWKTQLTSAEIALCQLLVRSEMVKLEYDLYEVQQFATFRIPWLFLCSFGEFFGRIYKRWQLDGYKHIRLTFATYANRWFSLSRF